jgi:hypothetical protein
MDCLGGRYGLRISFFFSCLHVSKTAVVLGRVLYEYYAWGSRGGLNKWIKYFLYSTLVCVLVNWIVCGEPKECE